jgi:hypothetical protein
MESAQGGRPPRHQTDHFLDLRAPPGRRPWASWGRTDAYRVDFYSLKKRCMIRAVKGRVALSSCRLRCGRMQIRR